MEKVKNLHREGLLTLLVIPILCAFFGHFFIKLPILKIGEVSIMYYLSIVSKVSKGRHRVEIIRKRIKRKKLNLCVNKIK